MEPKSDLAYEQAVVSAGGEVAALSDQVSALIWTDYSAPEKLAAVLEQNPQIEWVQLPFAGVDAFADVLSAPVKFTSAKGSYKEPVAEHALALSLALGRKIPVRVKATSWGKREAVSFYDSKILIVGAGGITQELIGMLKPFRASISVCRNQAQIPVPGSSDVFGLEQLAKKISEADLVVIACALTDKTRGLFDLELMSKMQPTAFLVNVARGPIINTADLLTALDQGLLAGAAVDVTDPEPLPDGHPFFGRDDLIVTPHTADTKEIVMRHFALRVQLNVKAYLGQGPWVGEVDPGRGY
ncbi:MAG: hydroxyacid dehydrogenase [Actinobacteria bacterium]|nr:hydroxyacid dehydrogenase [Actinomycetota bacterium]